jgi:hypothetical protein
LALRPVQRLAQRQGLQLVRQSVLLSLPQDPVLLDANPERFCGKYC